MPVLVKRHPYAERVVPLGYGVQMTFKRFTYAQYKAVESLAHSRARSLTELPEGSLLDLDGTEPLEPEIEAALIGSASELLLDTLVNKFALSWVGVLDGDQYVVDKPETHIELPLNADTWLQFRTENPMNADILMTALVRPYGLIDAEGKGSAPLQTTDIPGA